MEFLTLHQISLQFDIPVRVLRYRLRRLLRTGELIDGEDYRREDYVDDTHFVWKINTGSLVRLTGPQSVNHAATHGLLGVNRVVSEPQPITTQAPTTGSPTLPNLDTKTLPNVDTKSPAIEREMIDLLKEQVRVKDGQIADLTSQSKTLTALNEKLTGAVVHQGEEIRNLLRLTGGKTEADPVRTAVDTDAAVAGSSFASEPDAGGKPTDANSAPVVNRDWPHHGGGRAVA